MTELKHGTPSAGSTIKKIHAINPELNVGQLAAIIRECVETQGDPLGDFMMVQTINEEKALRLARDTVSE